ncbi:FecR family protein [Halosquirtibacter xylanolyticus]|uniref:FecR family protein n=1 Tax=Halosquirtibacter xylanolyticus TaxID=3374599 RepID=UPI003748CA86|nr:FecR family protein [Prolixibacteraceae bacterium]
MRNENKNRLQQEEECLEHEFPDIKISYSESPEEIWRRMSKELPKRELEKTNSKTIRMPWFYWAASILIFVGVGWTAIGYQSEFVVDELTQLIKLPDGSTVLAKKNSVITYRPLGWYLEREVDFDGEGFFKVMKGSQFTVQSDLGKTQVLGTSFNVLSSDGTFEVACYTGKVKVTANGDHEEIVLLLPKDSMTKLGKEKVKVRKQNKELSSKPSWVDQKFSFHQRSVYYISKRLEIEYGVKITVPVGLELKSTIIFDRPNTIYNALNLVCKPLGLSFVEEKEDYFVLTKQ